MAAYDVMQLNKETYTAEYIKYSPPDDDITLEYVSGVSNKSKSAIVASPSNGNVAFVASSVLVLFDPRHSKQAFVENPSSREIACVTFSDDGKYFAYGEMGHNPSVSVFNAKQFTQVNRFQVQEGNGSIKDIRFHPRSIYIALLLSYDYVILLYEFSQGRKLATAKWCVEPLAMTITTTNFTLAVCGHRKISYFFLSDLESTRYDTNAMLDKRAVLLGKHGNYTFIDIVCGQDRSSKCLFTITSCGYLCDIKAGVLKNVVKVSNRCLCMKFAFGLLFIGCDNGMVNICNPETLCVVACIDDNDLFERNRGLPIKWSIKSDIVAIAINEKTNIVTTLMSNQQMHSWSIRFVEDGFECSQVQVSESETNNRNHRAKLVTSHDMNCSLAQLLVQMEMTNHRQRTKNTNFLQREPDSRFRQYNAIKITPDGKDIIVGNRSGEIKVYEAKTGVLKKVIEAHNADVTFVEVMYDKDFKLVATGGRDRVIFILNAQNDYRLVQAINDHASAIVSISLAHNNGILTLVSSSKDGVILIRRAPKEETPKFITIGELPECLGSKKRSYNYSRGYIVTGQEKGRINVFPFDQNVSLKPVTKIQVGNSYLKAVVIDPTSSFFIALGIEGQYVFHLQSGQHIATLCYLPGYHHLSFSPDLNYFINSNDLGCKFMWRLPHKIIEVMQANLKDKSSTIVTSKELIFNSYMSCVRVCRNLVSDGGVEKEVSNSLESSKERSSNLTFDDFTNLSMEEKNILSVGNATFPLLAEECGCMTITDQGHELMNFLCDERHRLVESTSFMSSSTTYSRSLTDMTRVIEMDGGRGGTSNARSKYYRGRGEEKTRSRREGKEKKQDVSVGGDGAGDKGGVCDESSEGDSDTETLKLETKQSKILPVDKVDLKEIITTMSSIHETTEVVNSKAASSPTAKTGDMSQIRNCQSANVARGKIPVGHKAVVASTVTTEKVPNSVRNKNSPKRNLSRDRAVNKKTASSQSPSKKSSSITTRSFSANRGNRDKLYAVKCLSSHLKSDSTDVTSTDSKGWAVFQDSDSVVTARERVPAVPTVPTIPTVPTTCPQAGAIPAEISVRVDSKIDDLTTQGRESRTIDPTTNFKDSGLVEDLVTDCTFMEDQLEDPTVKKSQASSSHHKEGSVQNSRGGGLQNEDTNASTTMYTTPNADDDQDSYKRDLESLQDVDDSVQLQEYYTEFCRNIHLSNYQETYAVKDSAEYDLLEDIPCCLDDGSVRNDSGKGSTNSLNPLRNLGLSIDTHGFASSIEARLMGGRVIPKAYSPIGIGNPSDSELDQQDGSLRKMFLTWLRRKLYKERKKMKLLKAQCQRQSQKSPLWQDEGRGQVLVEDRDKGYSQNMMQDMCPSETVLDEFSTTTDSISPLEHYVTTSSNVTWTSNSSVCKEVLAKVSSDDTGCHLPSQTLSEPITMAMYDKSEVGLVQWQRYVRYGSKTIDIGTRSRNSSFKSDLSRNNLSPEIAMRSNSIVSRPSSAVNDYNSDSSGVLPGVAVEISGDLPINGNDLITGPMKSDELSQPSVGACPEELAKLPLENLQRGTTEGGTVVPAKKTDHRPSSEKIADSTSQNSVESLRSSPIMTGGSGMVNLFRNQDDYLRKLKEVRRNFELSIQELSKERKIQQIEAQNYFKEHK